MTQMRRAASDIPFVVLALEAGAILLYLGRSLSFWQDEWRSITFTGTAIDFLRPINQHWSTFPLLLYRSTFGVFQLHSYLPYLVELIVLHLLAVTGAYILMRRRVGPRVATALAIPLLLLGAGSENLFYAAQFGFVGSVMFGVWAMVFIERPGRWSPMIASVLLLASLMSSGMGLFFLTAVFGRTIFSPSLRMRTLAVVPPTAAYLLWYVLLSRQSGDLVDPLAVVPFVARGIGHSTGAITGLGYLPDRDLLAVALFFALLIATAWAVIAGRPLALAAGCLFATLAMYTLVGFVRAHHLESNFATKSRYVYVASFLLILAVADWLPELRARMTSQARRRVAVTRLLAIALIASIVVNIKALAVARDQFQNRADLTRAYIALALAHGDEPWVDPNSVPYGMPPMPLLLRVLERYGSPLRDTLVPGVAKAPGARAYEAALLGMVGDGYRVEPSAPSGEHKPVRVIETEDLVAAPDGDCIRLVDAGRNGAVTVSVPGGIRIRVTAASTLRGSALLGIDWPPSRPIDLDLAPGLPVDVLIPDIGDGRMWRVRLEVPGAIGQIGVCAVRTTAVASAFLSSASVANEAITGFPHFWGKLQRNGDPRLVALYD